jgi:hypothetical protein
MNFVVKADQDSRSSPNIVLFVTDPVLLPGIAARLVCDTIRQVFSLPKASNEVLQARARIRGCNIRTLNEIANKLFDSERYRVEQGLYVIDIVADDLVAHKNEFTWGDADLPGSAQQNINKVTVTKFDKERDIVDRFLQLLGYSNYSLHDPNLGVKVDTRADVLVEVGGRRIGVQVTEFHADEGAIAARQGSQLRSQESKKAAQGLPAAMFVNPNPMPGLVHRISEKSVKQWSSMAFNDTILLIAASVPQLGGTASTFVWAARLNEDELNAQLSPILEGSKYSAAYLFNMIDKSGPAVYKWCRQTGWKKLDLSDERQEAV